jgi:hypothetical protein
MSSLSDKSTLDSTFYTQLETFYNALFIGERRGAANDSLAVTDFKPAKAEYWTVRFEPTGVGDVYAFFNQLAREIQRNSSTSIVENSNEIGSRINRLINTRAINTETGVLTQTCLYVQGISIPGEAVDSITVPALPGAGNIQFPAVIGNRSDRHTLTIAFMESNMSVVDLVIRPWVNICAKWGLVAINFRTNIIADFVKVGSAKMLEDGSTQKTHVPTIRKTFKFYDCVPISVPEQSYSYSSAGLVKMNTTFQYQRYTVT